MGTGQEAVRDGSCPLGGGRFVWRGFVLWVPACFVLGILVAWAAVAAEEKFAPLIVFPLLVGVGLGALSVGLLRLGQVGNRPTVLLGTVLAASAADSSTFKDAKDKTSYMLGMQIGKQLKQSGAEINPDMYLNGLKDALSGGKTLLTDEEARQAMMAFQTEMRAKQQEKRKAEGEKSKKEGEAFLAENKKKEGVKVTPSGLQYKVVTTGSGPKPTTNDSVIAHYRGTLIDGTEFDSSYKRGEPTTFAVTGVIKGWTEALLMMNVGSKWQLFIPSDIAYGDFGRPPTIPAGATLLFDIELIAIKEKDKPKQPEIK